MQQIEKNLLITFIYEFIHMNILLFVTGVTDNACDTNSLPQTENSLQSK